MQLTVLHNPRCSKSRKALEILKDRGFEPKIVEYLKEPPSADDLMNIARRMSVPPTALIRRNEPTFRDAEDLPDLVDDAAVAKWLADNIKALQRPIVLTDDDRAVIGRPPEAIQELFDE